MLEDSSRQERLGVFLLSSLSFVQAYSSGFCPWLFQGGLRTDGGPDRPVNATWFCRAASDPWPPSGVPSAAPAAPLSPRLAASPLALRSLAPYTLFAVWFFPLYLAAGHRRSGQ